MNSREKNSVQHSDPGDLPAELEELRSENRRLEERIRELEESLETVRFSQGDTSTVITPDARKIQPSGNDRKSVELTLWETKEYFENLIIYANAPIIVWDPEFRITRFNHAFERLTGRSAEEVIGRELEILFPEETRNQSMEHILKTLAGERWESIEIPIMNRDGSVRTVLWNSATIFDQDTGKVTATIAQGQDITDRKTAERTLQETKDYLENLITYANAPIIVWDPEFRITRFNHAFERLTGRSAEEVIGRELGFLFPEETRNQSMEHILKTVAGERFEVKEIPIQHRDGSVRTVIWNLATIFNQDTGKVTATIAQGQDITDRMIAEEKIRHLASFPEMNPMPVLELDRDGRVLFCNEATHTLLQGFGAPDDSYLFVPSEIGTILRDMDRGITGTYHFEIPVGEATFIENLYVEPSRGVVRIYANDITPLRNTTNELKQYAEKLARSNRELEQFAYVASHDLREPLRMVTSFSQLLQHRYQGRLDSDADEFIDYIVDGATRMDRLIQDLLEYSRVTSRAQPFKPTDMNGVVHEVLRNLAVAIRESKVRITTDILPVVSADRSQMVQLVQNLVDNAVKYRCGDDPYIHIGAEQNGDGWTFSIQDNGIGIDPAYQERVFEIFQRLHSREEYPGTGIGLAICRRIIERHNGTIRVDSEIGEGSTFSFTIPDKTGISPGSGTIS